MSSDIEKLKAARELIARPGGWTQGVFARDANGEDIEADYSSAFCWCAAGAIKAVDGSLCGMVISYFRAAIDYELVAEWNDAPDRTQADVVAAFDRAIALAEAAHV